jgi:hypothetical protein
VHVAHRHVLDARRFSIVRHFLHKFQRSGCCALDEDGVACNGTTVSQWRLGNIKSIMR